MYGRRNDPGAAGRAGRSPAGNGDHQVPAVTAAEPSPRIVARVAGVLYLLTLLLGIFGQDVVSDGIVVPGDAAATAANILSHTSLFELGFAAFVVEMTCQIAMTALFYDLLKPVNRVVSLVAAFIGLAACTIKMFSRLFYIAPLLVLSGDQYLRAFGTAQLHALTLLSVSVNDYGTGIAMAFFGFAALVKGYLVVESSFLPRILGVLGMIAGLSLLTFLLPTLGPRMFTVVAALGLLGAVPMIFWLLVFGVNEERWKAQAHAGAHSLWK
jgi:hypothetical protein